MKLNLFLKILITLFLIIIVTNIFIPVNTFATDTGDFTDEETKYMNPNQFEDTGSYNKLSGFKIKDDLSIGGFMFKLFGMILKIVRIIALGWAIIMAISIAIKYFTGSAQIKSQLKTDMPTYIIGAVLLFGAAGLITIIQYFVEDFFPG